MRSSIQCFKRVAIIKCFYSPSLKYIPKSDTSKDYFDKSVENFMKKYPELKKEKITLRASGLNYNFDVGDIIPNNMPEKNIFPVVYYKLTKSQK
jgi:hypothetical protein